MRRIGPAQQKRAPRRQEAHHKPRRRGPLAPDVVLRHCCAPARVGLFPAGDTEGWDDMRRYVIAGLLLIGAGSGEAAAENYGAIAYSPSTKAYGWSYDYPSRAAAEREALSRCRTKASDCMIPLWFRDACGALAIGSGGYGTGWASERGSAESQALGVCRRHSQDCAVKQWVCTTR
jgi:Domain of unknown function (DUF4189)